MWTGLLAVFAIPKNEQRLLGFYIRCAAAIVVVVAGHWTFFFVFSFHSFQTFVIYFGLQCSLCEFLFCVSHSFVGFENFLCVSSIYKKNMKWNAHINSSAQQFFVHKYRWVFFLLYSCFLCSYVFIFFFPCFTFRYRRRRSGEKCTVVYYALCILGSSKWFVRIFGMRVSIYYWCVCERSDLHIHPYVAEQNRFFFPSISISLCKICIFSQHRFFFVWRATR